MNTSQRGGFFRVKHKAQRFKFIPRKKNENKALAFIRRLESENVNLKPEPEHQVNRSFKDFALNKILLRNLEVKGFSTPTAIQDLAIERIMEGRDVVGLANTGTGKTAAFLLPLLDKVARDRQQKVLILAPTRELALQIHEEFIEFSRGTHLLSVLCTGGSNMHKQIHQLRKPYNFVIGTPGRVMDLFQRRLLFLNRINNIVLDEADRMVDMGFIKDMRLIFKELASPRQTLFFTATMEKEVGKLAEEFLLNPVQVSAIKRKTSANVQQEVLEINSEKTKIEKLVDLLAKPDFERVLIFGRTKFGVERLMKDLKMSGFKVDSIHGDKSQSYRFRALQAFKNGQVKILVATDVASRGLHIDKVSHVVNYDLPENYDDYIHRIGRTGRADQKGKAISFVVKK